MSDEAQAQPGTVPALGLSYKTILDREGRREVVYQTHVEQDVEPGALNALLDKLTKATDRQIAQAELASLAAEESELDKRITRFRSAAAELDVRSKARWESSGKHGPWNPDKLPPQERSERQNIRNSLDQDKERLVRLRARAEELRQVVNEDALAGSANCYVSSSDR
jgi:glutamate synthase domain-containing protein 2